MRTDQGLDAEVLETRELFRAVIESAAEAVWITDTTGRVAIANAVARDLVGLGPDDRPMLREILLRAHLRTIDGRVVEHGQGPTSRALRGETTRGEYAFFHALTGQETIVRVVSAPIREPQGAIRGAIVLMHDLTDVRRAEREKEEFLSIITHELRTPLTPLKTVAQLIRSRLKKVRGGVRELDLDVLESNVATIERQVDRMDRLVSDLLDVSRLGRGRLELRPGPFDLAALVREVVERWSDTLADEGRDRIELESPASLPVTADQQRIEQVVMNLIGNAVKYSLRGGNIRVRLERTDGHAALTVSDRGIGVDGDELPLLGREPFFRGRRAEGYAGVGIGLYLSRILAEGHGGRLEVASEGADKGTTAKLTIPL